jgi:hypothetical protein
MIRSITVGTVTAVATALIALSAAPAQAQLNGENLLGDTGVKNGTQSAPGWYLGSLNYRYHTDTIRNADGRRVIFDPNRSGSQTIHATVPLVIYVSKAKIFGANVGMMAVMPFANGTLEAPALGFEEKASTGPGDAYLVPLQLGWHTRRADVTAAFGLFAPTGRYDPDATDNLGKGMWSYELSLGTTIYLDRARTLSVSTTGFWETHSEKAGSAGATIGHGTSTGVTVGQIFTLEGGVAREFLHGAAHVGMAYYGQWKLTPDQLGIPADAAAAEAIGRHRVWALGPDVTIPLGTKSRLISLLNFRYLWEIGARMKTQGPSMLLTATFPVPSIKIPAK